MVRFHRSDVIHQLKIELFHEFIKCAGSHVGTNFGHDQINGRGRMLSILRDGRFNTFSGIVEVQLVTPSSYSMVYDSSKGMQQLLHLRHEILPAIGSSGKDGVDSSGENPFGLGRSSELDQCTPKGQM